MDTYLARRFPGFYHGGVYKTQVTVPEINSYNKRQQDAQFLKFIL